MKIWAALTILTVTVGITIFYLQHVPQPLEEEVVALGAPDPILSKALELKKVGKVPKTKVKDISIEIIEINEIEGGVSVLAKAWDKNGRQYGFGEDGTVDIERFLFYGDVPLHIESPDGEIVDTQYNLETGEPVVTRYTLNPKQAILNELEFVIGVKKQKYDDSKIEKGKVGNTTSTFYPQPSSPAETVSVDGWTVNESTGTWSSTCGAATGTGANDSNASIFFAAQLAGADKNCSRFMTLFDTSAIPDTDDISSATYSVKRNDTILSFQNADSSSFGVVSSSPAVNTAVTTADFDQYGSTEFATRIALSATTDEVYADFSLNASGISNISKTGVSKFGVRSSLDLDTSTPTGLNRISFHSADAATQANDPKLVVEHAAPAAGGTTVGEIIWF